MLDAVTVKLVVVVAEVKLLLAACIACNVTVPEPVTVTMLPAIVAGPPSTAYVIAPAELELAETANGAAPVETEATGEKVSLGATGFAVKLVVAVAAG